MIVARCRRGTWRVPGHYATSKLKEMPADGQALSTTAALYLRSYVLVRKAIPRDQGWGDLVKGRGVITQSQGTSGGARELPAGWHGHEGRRRR